MKRALVAYFSITGVTGNMARKLAEAVSADLYEIMPRQPYSSSDLDQRAGENAAIPVSFEHKNIDAYDVIFVGLPIWWYAAPTIIHTFLSDYDLRGKVLIPFATSGGGGLDKVRPRLLESCPGADLREATLLTDDMTAQDLLSWAESFAC